MRVRKENGSEGEAEKIRIEKKFYYTKENGKRVNLLNLGVPGYNTIRPSAPPKKFAKVIKTALSELDPKKDLQGTIRITYYGKYPEKPHRDEYVAIGRRIKTY